MTPLAYSVAPTRELADGRAKCITGAWTTRMDHSPTDLRPMDLRRLNLPEFARGSVWLVGAGPGDPGLLSVLALHALDLADQIVYDALVDPRILALARPQAVLEYAGKRGGRPSPRQTDISTRLIALARGEAASCV